MTESPEWKLKVFTNTIEILTTQVSLMVKEPLISGE